METLSRIRSYLKKNLSEKRYEHSESVENTSVLLADRFGIDSRLCALAGLSHDICRELDSSELLNLTGVIHESPVLLHGQAGAVLLRSRFKIENNSVLNAVRYHTSGSSELDDIGKVVFAADYLEPLRNHLSKQERERLFLLGLNDIVLEIASKTKAFLESRGFTVEEDLTAMILKLGKDAI